MNTQMNVRIDEQLKRRGDEVFKSMGLTPTQVVRQVWEFAAAHREAPEIVRAALGDPTSWASTRREQVLEASSICARFRERLGLEPPDKLEDIDYRALREEAMYERLQERGQV